MPAKKKPAGKPSPKAREVVVVSNHDDWEGIYVDGVLRAENHSLTVREILQILGVKTDFREVSPEWLGGEVGSLPEKLGDIPEEAYDPDYGQTPPGEDICGGETDMDHLDEDEE